MKRFLIFLVVILALIPVIRTEAKQFTVVIDAGHGGHDSGAIGANSKEKNINLNVALALGDYIQQTCPDVKIIYTRKTDVFVPLNERANIANRNNADLFISVHTNSLPAGKVARGFETYTLGMHRAKDNLDVAMRENSVISMEKDYKQTYQGFDPNSSESYIMFEFVQSANMEKSVELARMIQKSVCKTANRPDKGVHQAGFLVLRETTMPGCLIELGFITSSEEEAYLNSEQGIAMMAKGIGEAFRKYKNQYGQGTAAPYIAPKDEPALRTGRLIPSDPDAPSVTISKRKSPAAQKPEMAKPKESKPVTTTTNGPIFKVQIFCANSKLPKGSAMLKGHTDYGYYEEDGMVKYTIGESADYNAINRLRKELDKDFPQCFVVAFKDNKKTNINAAIKEFMTTKRK